MTFPRITVASEEPSRPDIPAALSVIRFPAPACPTRTAPTMLSWAPLPIPDHIENRPRARHNSSEHLGKIPSNRAIARRCSGAGIYLEVLCAARHSLLPQTLSSSLSERGRKRQKKADKARAEKGRKRQKKILPNGHCFCDVNLSSLSEKRARNDSC